MSFLRTRTNPLNRMFFEKFQHQVSQASGFKPLLSYEDFLSLIEKQKQENEKTNNTVTNE